MESARGYGRVLVHAGASVASGLHRRAGGGRFGGDARRDQAPWRRPGQNQSASARRPGDRSFGAGRCVRQRDRVCRERASRIRAQPGTLPLSAMGPALVQQFPRRAARHRNRPSGQSRISGAGGFHFEQGRGVPGYRYRHGFAHHDDQRPGRGRMGRGRNRSRGRDAWAVEPRCWCRRLSAFV